VSASNVTPSPLRVGLISLGCAKNLVDAELMLGALLREGIEITNNAAQADAVIVNTCSFIDAAQEESVDTILESAAVREARQRGQALLVAGCLPQRFRDDLPRLFPEVDAFLGIDQVTEVGALVRRALARRAERVANPKTRPVSQPLGGARRQAKVTARLAELDQAKAPAADKPAPATPVLEVHRRPTFIPDFAMPRFRLTPRHFAYVKIAEGCNHPCSFCIIPRMRGSHRSRPLADVVEEARRLLAEGVKELNLISQDSTYYGLDLRPNHSRAIASPERFRAAAAGLPADAPTLARLLRELNALPGEFWIRILYTHPAHWTDELIHAIAGCPKVARYLDLPLQHIHPLMLQRMRRETSREYIEDLIRRLRASIPGVTLRTTFIVGFPGETAAIFESLLEFVRETRFDRLGVFTYSREDGTVAGRMAGQVPRRVRKQRRVRVMAAQHEIARSLAAAQVGREVTVLTEGPARAPQLQAAQVFNWEHGFLREAGGEAAAGPTRGYTVARSEGDAPDIDGRVYVRGRLPAGEFRRVRVIGHTDYDLVAEPR
jgi:ribosomal protein S12 methylthiotransferase